MYDNLELWSDTEEGQDKAVLVIRQGMVNHSLVIRSRDQSFPTLVELTPNIRLFNRLTDSQFVL